MTPNHQKKIFVLDTNVLMHDPASIFRFQEHDIVLPIVVLEELDHSKKGVSEVARNLRQVSRFIGDLVEKAGGDISRGLKLPSHGKDFEPGRLYFHLEAVRSPLPHGLSAPTPDNTLLGVTLDLGVQHPDKLVILVSKDINLRIKASALGLRAEDYNYDFKSDLPIAERTEHEIANIISKVYNAKIVKFRRDNKYDIKAVVNGKAFTFEVKEDFTCARTGNVAVEYSSWGRPAGIAVIKADFYIYKIHTDRGVKIFIFKTQTIKNMMQIKNILRLSMAGMLVQTA